MPKVSHYKTVYFVKYTHPTYMKCLFTNIQKQCLFNFYRRRIFSEILIFNNLLFLLDKSLFIMAFMLVLLVHMPYASLREVLERPVNKWSHGFPLSTVGFYFSSMTSKQYFVLFPALNPHDSLGKYGFINLDFWQSMHLGSVLEIF